jgi:hypothetical protein
MRKQKKIRVDWRKLLPFFSEVVEGLQGKNGVFGVSYLLFVLVLKDPGNKPPPERAGTRN